MLEIKVNLGLMISPNSFEIGGGDVLVRCKNGVKITIPNALSTSDVREAIDKRGGAVVVRVSPMPDQDGLIRDFVMDPKSKSYLVVNKGDSEGVFASSESIYFFGEKKRIAY